MARGSLTEDERHCFDANAKNQEKSNAEAKPNGLRVRFLDEEGKTERMVSADEVDCAVSRVKKIHILKNRSSSETSLFLRNPSLAKRVTNAERRLSDGNSDKINNNNSSNENLNGKTMLKLSEFDNDNKKTDSEHNTKETNGHYKKNCNVYSVNQAKTLSAERRKSLPMSMPRLMSKSNDGVRSMLPAEGSLAEAAAKDFATRTLGRLSRGLGRLLRRTNSVRISEPDPVFKVAYLGNVLTGWARGENCIEKPLATLWRNYQQSSKPDVVMKLSVTNSGLKGFTKEHGLTEYWSHRVTYCASPPHYPRLFCWVYRHEGKKLKHELRCHAVLCTKETVSKKITEELQVKLKQALQEFKKDRICKQNARLSLANSVYENPSMPRRKILLSVGATNYRPPLERSKSAPKLGAIEELCSEEDEEEAEMKDKQELCGEWSNSNEDFTTQTLDRRRNVKSPRKYSCPDGFLGRSIADTIKRSSVSPDDIINLIVNESSKKEIDEASQYEGERFHRLESIDEKHEMENVERNKIIMQSNYLVTDSDDGSVSSGCETASTAASDSEPTSLPLHFQPEDQIKEESELVTEIITAFERMQNYDLTSNNENHICSDYDNHYEEIKDEVNHVPIGENNAFRRRSTYPPLGAESTVHSFENKYESLADTMTDFDSIKSADADNFKNSGDNESACSDESGYSELLENGKDSIIGNTIMV